MIQIVEDAHGGKMEKKNKTNKHCLINVIYITIKTQFLARRIWQQSESENYKGSAIQ